MMDCHKINNRTNPRLKSNIFSRLFLCWIFPLLSYGNRYELETKDTFLTAENRSQFLGDKFEKYWNAEVKDAQKKKRRPSMWKVISKTFSYTYFKHAIAGVAATVSYTILPPVLKLLISYFEENSNCTMLEACFYAFLMMLIMILQTLIINYSQFPVWHIGGQIKTACSALIYKKILRLPISTKDGGRIITLLSNDVARFEEGFTYFYTFFNIPIICIMNGFMMWRVLGFTTVFGMLTIILQNIPIQIFFVRLMIKLRERTARRTDHRLLMMDEIINGIHVIKMYTWEKPFKQLILLARRKELDVIIKKLYLHVGLGIFMKFSRCTSLYITIAILIAYEEKLSSVIMYPLILYNFNMNYQTGYSLYKFLISIADMTAAVNRIEGPLADYLQLTNDYTHCILLQKSTIDNASFTKLIFGVVTRKAANYNISFDISKWFLFDFLLFEEVAPISKLGACNNRDIVTIKSVTASWSECDNHNVLKDINISIAPKKLYAVIGEIGSGKSFLLKVILGEIKPKSGQVLNYGEVAFASQEPWLFNGSVRSNILLGEPFDEEKYKEVISSCALLKDFEQLPHGDKTIVGERGASLSGGQRARINLARAVYRNADVYLLDDPLASIDYCASKHIFDNCINGLLKDKSRILVTQKLEYIKKVDEIIYINNEGIAYQGDYENFQKTAFFQYLSKSHEVDMTLKKDDLQRSQKSISSFVNVDAEGNEACESKETEELLSEYKDNVQLTPYEDPRENIEPIKQGKIPFSIHKEFYNNKILIIFITIFLVISHSCIGSFDYLIAVWSENQDRYFSNSNSSFSNHLNTKSNFSDSQLTLFYIIGGIILGLIISSIMELILFVKLHRKSCERLHNSMISSLLTATLQFFVTNDSGRILNRFSQDLGAVDEQVPIMLMEVVKMMIVLFVSILQIVITSPYMSIPVIISLLLVYRMTTYFGKSIRSTKRLEARAKALVLSHVNATFNGLITIRSSCAQVTVQRNFNILQDDYMAAYFTTTDIFWSYAIWNDMAIKSLRFLIASAFIFLKSTGITSATVGYVLTQLYVINSNITLAAEFATQFDLSMISTERSLEYTKLEDENIEKPTSMRNIVEKTSMRKSAISWPSLGEIKFDNLSLKYWNSIDPVLKNINFVIEPGTKVAIIGRTGAGKSSLAAALFRLAETEGSLLIDGIDTKTVALKDLRSKISILPQKSILFSTSLRKNLDPLELFDDAKIWSTLKCVKLDNNFNSLDEQLNQWSLSSGQRQLLCLARAMLKKNKILILDEATASTDTRTDELIQNTIRENFKDCTVLTIAHKINSIADCDKILVVDAGQVVEYDEPRVLLQQKNSYFYKLWQLFKNN